MTSRQKIRPNLRAVAQLAGVSTATVSRALNTPERLEPRTLSRVLECVQTLGYVPNMAGRSLVLGRTHAVGVIVPNIGWPLFASFARGIEKELNAARLMPITVSTDDLTNQEPEAVQALIERSVDGLIVVSCKLRPLELQKIAGGKPIIHINPQFDGHRHQIRLDDELGGYLAADFLIRTGHRRLAHVSGGYRSGKDRRAGWLRRLAEEGLKPYQIFEGDFTTESGEAAVSSFLETGIPDAIFAASDLMAAGVCRALNQAGIRVPDAVSVIGFDDDPIAALLDPPLCTLRQPGIEMGRAAGKLFLSVLEGEGPVNEIVAPELLKRPTVRPRLRK